VDTIVLENQGGSSVSVALQTSYDREVWVDVASASAGADTQTVIIPAIEVLAPFVQEVRPRWPPSTRFVAATHSVRRSLPPRFSRQRSLTLDERSPPGDLSV